MPIPPTQTTAQRCSRPTHMKAQVDTEAQRYRARYFCTEGSPCVVGPPSLFLSSSSRPLARRIKFAPVTNDTHSYISIYTQYFLFFGALNGRMGFKDEQNSHGSKLRMIPATMIASLISHICLNSPGKRHSQSEPTRQRQHNVPLSSQVPMLLFRTLLSYNVRRRRLILESMQFKDHFHLLHTVRHRIVRHALEFFFFPHDGYDYSYGSFSFFSFWNGIDIFP